MKKISKYLSGSNVLAAFFAFMLFLCLSGITVKADDDSYVILYKNGEYVQKFDTVNQAFDSMTDRTADYVIEMLGSQILYGYEQWPTVSSITITVPEDDSEYGWSTNFALQSEYTTINSDVHLKDWVTLRGVSQNEDEKSKTINLGDYSLIVDDAGGHYTYISDISIIGGDNSKIVFDGGCQGFWGCTFNVSTVITNGNGFFDLNDSKGEKSHVKNWYTNGRFSINGNVEVDNLYAVDSFSGQPGQLTLMGANALIHNISASAINIWIDSTDYVNVEGYNQIAKIDGTFDGNIFVNVEEYNDDNYSKYKPSMDLSKLFYAPNIKTDVSLSYTLDNSDGSGRYTFNTALAQRDGYYGFFGQFPEFNIDGRVINAAFAGDYTKAVSFGDKANLKNVEYTVEPYDWNKVISESQVYLSSTDDSVSVHIKDLSGLDKFKVKVKAEYTYGTMYHTIPVYIVDSIGGASFDKDYVEFNDGYFNNYSYVINLTYDKPSDSSKENVVIYSTDTDIISFTKEKTDSGYCIKVSAIGCGTAAIKAIVNDKECVCNFKVAMPVNAYDSDESYMQTSQRINNTTFKIAKGESKYIEAIPVLAFAEKPLLGYDISFKSSDDSLLKITSIKNYKVYVTALKAGSASLIINCNGFETQIPFTVTKQMIGNIEIPDNYTGMVRNDEDGKRYWFDDGIMARDKQVYSPQDDAWYWFDADGTMAVDKDVYVPESNENRENGKWVRYDSEGHMVKGEDFRYGGWYRFDEITGEMIKGFYTDNSGRTCYYNMITGQMEHGMVLIDGVEYAFDNETGAALNNAWYELDGNCYWYENGVRQGMQGRGKEIYDPASDAWYWLDSIDGGKKAVSKDVYQESYAGQYADNKENQTGKWVRYDADGRMVKGWSYNENGTYYFDLITGAMAKGTTVIDGVEYTFSWQTGILAEIN